MKQYCRFDSRCLESFSIYNTNIRSYVIRIETQIDLNDVLFKKAKSGETGDTSFIY
jgi:hypothetical protein